MQRPGGSFMSSSAMPASGTSHTSTATATPPVATRTMAGWRSPMDHSRYAGAVRASRTKRAPAPTRLPFNSRPRMSVPLTASNMVTPPPTRAGDTRRRARSPPARARVSRARTARSPPGSARRTGTPSARDRSGCAPRRRAGGGPGVRQPDQLGHLLDVPAQRGARDAPPEPAQRLRDGVERGEPRIQAVGGVLEDHLDARAGGDRREARRRHRADVLALEVDAPVGE